MGVAVYPRLGPLLRARDLSVLELCRQIESRFGLATDPKTLYRLAADAPIQRADLEVAGAAAALLDVTLDDLFEVRAEPEAGEDDGVTRVLDPAQSRRLAALFERQSRGLLLPAEQDELDGLVAAYAHRLRERALRAYAEQRGVSLEEARRESEADLADALRWWRDLEAHPARRRALAGRRARAPRRPDA